MIYTHKMITINPTKKITDAQKVLLRDFFQQNPELQYIDKNKTYVVKGTPDTEIQFSNPLIRAKADDKQYYAIETTSNMLARNLSKEDIEQRKGAYSNVRPIVASIKLNTNGDLLQLRVKGKVVRVKNRSKARHENYKHESAVEDYNKMREFPHLAPETPVEVKKQDNYTKSYTVMNELEGVPVNVAASGYSGYADTKILLDSLIIPIFESYSEQVAKQGKVHCDIKPPNILALVPENFLEEKCKISFLDFDFSENIGAVDKHRGTPCYMPPFNPKHETTLTSARDMFALAMIAIEIINPDLGSTGITYSSIASSSTGDTNNIADKTWQDTFSSIIAEGGNYYNLTHVINKQYAEILRNAPETPMAELFYNYCEQNEPQKAHHDLMALLESIAQTDADKVPSLESVIAQLQHISNEIKVDYDLEAKLDEAPSANSSLNIARALSSDPKGVLQSAAVVNKEDSKEESKEANVGATTKVNTSNPVSAVDNENNDVVNRGRLLK